MVASWLSGHGGYSWTPWVRAPQLQFFSLLSPSRLSSNETSIIPYRSALTMCSYLRMYSMSLCVQGMCTHTHHLYILHLFYMLTYKCMCCNMKVEFMNSIFVQICYILYMYVLYLLMYAMLTLGEVYTQCTYVRKASLFNTKDRDTSRVAACLIHWVFSAVHCSCSIYTHVRIHVSNSYSPKLTLVPEL